jgi:energy-coupling factor transporter ATP-binding protein EcfA2
VRIIKLAIQDFRAFYSTHIIELAKVGESGKQNLLVYGENGSGKSSLLLALQYLLESGIDNLDFNNYRNIFSTQLNSGYIELTLRETIHKPEIVHKWSPYITTTATDRDIIEASKAKGILDYKRLLEVHFIHRHDSKINIFDLLVKNLLAHCINDTDTSLVKRTFSQQWEDLITIIPKRRKNNRQIAAFEKASLVFNEGLKAKLNELERKIAGLIDYFGYPITISFGFEQGVSFDNTIKYSEERPETSIANREILLNVKFHDREVPSPHHFLNEAKLTAIAIAIYFSSLLVVPKPTLKLLVLDDIFIGLDMSNRLPLIDILKEKFSDYQIFLMTYDREWYEILKQRLGSKWRFQELYHGVHENQLEIPVWRKDKTYLEKAEDYLTIHHDLKASAVYLRTAFEVILKEFCDHKRIKVVYKEDRKKVSSDDFWQSVKTAKKNDGTLYVDCSLAQNVELYRNIIMNPLSHSRIVQVYRQEVEDAIATIKKLKQALS